MARFITLGSVRGQSLLNCQRDAAPLPELTMSQPNSAGGRPLFIGSEIYRRSSYGSKHPLAIPRVSTVIDLCRALGWLGDDNYVDSPIAGLEQLSRFHDVDYVRAVMQAEAEQDLTPAQRKRYNLGSVENPIFGEIFSRPATACGASILAAELLAGGPGVIYSPAGGTHHGRPDRASGFCYFNDPVLAILTLLDLGIEPVFYLDLDAHHGDGVEDALAGDERVTTLSVHEADRWPRSGATGLGAGTNTFNLAVPRDLNDSEHALIMEWLVVPLIAGFRPAALVVQAGADSLADDPLSRLALSNGALASAIGKLRGLCDRLLVLGGGGYNPWSVARAWTGVWGALNGHELPVRIDGEAQAVLRSLTWNRAAGRNPPDHWFETLLDPPNEGPVRSQIHEAIEICQRPPGRPSDM